MFKIEMKLVILTSTGTVEVTEEDSHLVNESGIQQVIIHHFEQCNNYIFRGIRETGKHYISIFCSIF